MYVQVHVHVHVHVCDTVTTHACMTVKEYNMYAVHVLPSCKCYLHLYQKLLVSGVHGHLTGVWGEGERGRERGKRDRDKKEM